MQNTMNQMGPPMPQNHFMNMNHMHSGSPGGPPPGGIPNGMQNMQGSSNASGNQMFPQGGSFNRPQAPQMPPMPGLNPFQVIYFVKAYSKLHVQTCYDDVTNDAPNYL